MVVAQVNPWDPVVDSSTCDSSSRQYVLARTGVGQYVLARTRTRHRRNVEAPILTNAT